MSADDTGIIEFRDKAVTHYESQFQQWQAQNFGGDPNSPSAAWNADPDGDGIGNCCEYAFNLSPNDFSASPWTLDSTTVSSQKYLRLTIPKNPAATDITYEIQATGDLSTPANWSSSGLIIEEDTSTTLRVRDSVPMAPGPPRFMRVKIDR